MYAGRRLTEKLPLTRNAPVLSIYVRKQFPKASVPIMLIPRTLTDTTR
jgi:hypothetical protein